MKIGVAGPVEIDLLLKYLCPTHQKLAATVRGLGGSQVTQLVEEYIRLGHQVSVYTLDTSVKIGEPRSFEGQYLKIYIGPFRRNKRMIFDFQVHERVSLIRFIRDDDPDVIHAHWTYEFAQAAIASKVPHVVSVRDWAPAILRLMPKPYRFMRLLMSDSTIKKASFLTANSPYISERIFRHYAKTVNVVPNGIADTLLLKEGKEQNHKCPNIICISNGFGRPKNVKNLIRAHYIYNEKTPYKTSLKLVGIDFEKQGPAQRWAIKNNLDNDHIEYIGALPRVDTMKELSGADLMVHPALEESFGNTLIEAMALKVPVIAGINSGAPPWVLDNGAAGVLVDITDHRHISDAIEFVLCNNANWEKYSVAGHQRVASIFCISKVAKKYVELLEATK